MKAFLALCLLSVASAQHYGGYQGAPQHAGPTGGYQGPLHIPVLNANGVPQEPAAVVQARNAHLANFGGAAPQGAQHDQYQGAQYQGGQYQDDGQYREEGQYQPQQYQQQQYQAQPQYQAQQQHYQPQQQYQAQHQVPQAKLGADGLPQDAPDVAAAKAAHFAAYAEANSRNGHPAAQQYAPAPQHYAPQPQHYAPAPQHYAAPQAGLPQDTPEVAAAKAAHFAAHAALPPQAPQQHY